MLDLDVYLALAMVLGALCNVIIMHYVCRGAGQGRVSIDRDVRV